MMRRGVRIAPAVGLACLLGGPACAHAGAIVAAGPEGFSPGDFGHVAATLLIFIVLLRVLKKWAWGPIVRQLRAREQSVAESLDRAAKREQQSQEVLALHKARLDAAQAEGADILTDARKTAAEARDKVLQSARTERADYMDRARQEMEQARLSTIRDLQTATADLASDIAAQLMRRGLDQAEHERLIEQSLDEIRARSAEDS